MMHANSVCLLLMAENAEYLDLSQPAGSFDSFPGSRTSSIIVGQQPNPRGLRAVAEIRQCRFFRGLRNAAASVRPSLTAHFQSWTHIRTSTSEVDLQLPSYLTD